MNDLWCSMTGPEEMFVPRPWLARLLSEAPAWMELVGSTAKPAEPPRSWLPIRRRKPDIAEASELPADDPVTEALTPDEELPAEGSLGLLAQLAGSLGKISKLGGDLMAARSGLEQSRSMYRPGPVLAGLLDPTMFQPARVRDSGVELRIAMVALETGRLHYMRGDGVLTNREGTVLDATGHDLTRGILASCAIPGVFRPVPIGAETYVDGGARENVPAEMAIGHLGADRTYVVTSQADGVPRRTSMAEADIFQVVMRATEILMDEAGRDEVAYAVSAGAVVITPEVDVHDAMTVHPGLLQIFRDHGWSRAATVVTQADSQTAALLRRITEQRMRCLRREEAWLAAVDDREALVDLQAAKLDLRDMVAQAPVELLPPGAPLWWAEFEAHPVQPEVEAPWLEL